MDYTLEKHQVIYIIPGRKNFRIDCIDGILWVTREADIQDVILQRGDAVCIESRGKIAVQAFHNSRLLFKGRKFTLYELRRDENDQKLILNKINVRQTIRTG